MHSFFAVNAYVIVKVMISAYVMIKMAGGIQHTPDTEPNLIQKLASMQGHFNIHLTQQAAHHVLTADQLT